MPFKSRQNTQWTDWLNSIIFSDYYTLPTKMKRDRVWIQPCESLCCLVCVREWFVFVYECASAVCVRMCECVAYVCEWMCVCGYARVRLVCVCVCETQKKSNAPRPVIKLTNYMAHSCRSPPKQRLNVLIINVAFCTVIYTHSRTQRQSAILVFSPSSHSVTLLSVSL